MSGACPQEKGTLPFFLPFSTDGKASIDVDGIIKNSRKRGRYPFPPAKVLASAADWIFKNSSLVEDEWIKMNNPRKR